MKLLRARRADAAHHLTVGGLTFALDIPTSSAFRVTGSREEALAPLRAQGLFRPDPRPPAPHVKPWSKAVELSVTHRCTMRCRYCYSDHEAGSRDAPLDMPDDVLDAACDWAVKDFAREAPYVHLTTGVTGEALLRIDAYRRVCRQAERLRAETGKHISHAVGSSNLSLAGEAEAWALLSGPEQHVFSISLDGPRHIHDAMRVFPDGRGTYDTIVPPLLALLKQGRRLVAQAVITAENPDVTGVFTHLCDLGFAAVILRPVRVPRGTPFGLGPNTIAAVKQGFTDFVTFLLSVDDDARLLHYLKRLWHISDFLGRFLVRVSTQQRVFHRCPAGSDWACVDTDGAIYPCPGMIGIPELRMGSVFTGTDPAALALYQDGLVVTRKASCRDCWARYFCGGGCYHAAFVATGRVETPDPYDCELMQHLIELAIYLVSRLKEERPAVLAAIQHPPDGMVDAASVVPCRKVESTPSWDGPAEEWRSRSPLRFDRAEQMHWRIWAGPADLSGEVHLRWDAEALYVMAEVESAGLAARQTGELLGLYLAVPEEVAEIGMPDWWKGYADTHYLSYDLAQEKLILRTGREELGGSPTTTELPARVEREGDTLRLRAVVPWSELTMLAPGREAALAVTASLYRPGEDGAPVEMQWLEDYAFGILRLVE